MQCFWECPNSVFRTVWFVKKSYPAKALCSNNEGSFPFYVYFSLILADKPKTSFKRIVSIHTSQFEDPLRRITSFWP